MSLTLQEKILNGNQTNRRIDNFHVTFFGIPENVSNIMGRQVKSLTRPTIDVQTAQRRHRSHTFKDTANMILAPVTLSFFDDEESITSMFLYAQLFRQLNKHSDKYGKWGIDRQYKFDVKVECFNSRNKVTEAFIMRDCFIQNIDHSDPVYSNSDECEISITLEYNDLDVMVFDEYISMLGEVSSPVTPPVPTPPEIGGMDGVIWVAPQPMVGDGELFYFNPSMLMCDGVPIGGTRPHPYTFEQDEVSWELLAVATATGYAWGVVEMEANRYVADPVLFLHINNRVIEIHMTQFYDSGVGRVTYTFETSDDEFGLVASVEYPFKIEIRNQLVA